MASFFLSVQIVRPGGMERPTDAYKETHNITLSVEDTLFGGLVSNLQVFPVCLISIMEYVGFNYNMWCTTFRVVLDFFFLAFHSNKNLKTNAFLCSN